MIGDGLRCTRAGAGGRWYCMGGGSDVAIETAAITLSARACIASPTHWRVAGHAAHHEQNLLGALSTRDWHPYRRGVLYPLTGTLLSPVIAGAAMALSSTPWWQTPTAFTIHA